MTGRWPHTTAGVKAASEARRTRHRVALADMPRASWCGVRWVGDEVACCVVCVRAVRCTCTLHVHAHVHVDVHAHVHVHVHVMVHALQ
jgi:hypothetical protein